MSADDDKPRVRPVLFATALAAATLSAFPIWFMVTSAFKAEPEIMAIPIHWWPHEFQGLARFQEAAEFAPLWRYLFNSTVYSVVHVAMTVFFGALAGFGSGLLADSAWRVYCEVSDPQHVLTAHAVGVVALSAIGALAGVIVPRLRLWRG